MLKTNKSEYKTTGQHLASVFDMRSPKAMAIEKEIENHIRKPFYANHRKHYLQMINELKQLFLVREYLVENIIVLTGRAAVAKRLANITTYTGIINYGMLGTGSTTPTNADTTLTIEVFRKTVASASSTDNQSFIDFFYSKADWNGTAEEFGTAIDGAAGVDTGQLFTHALTGSWVKSASESLTVACTYTLS